MANYTLRDVDDRLWSRLMVRAQIEGWPLKALIVQLVTDYADGKTRPGALAPMAPARRVGPYVTLRFTCPHCNRAMEVDILHTSGFSYMLDEAIVCPHCQQPTRRMLPGQIMHSPGNTLAIRPVGDERPGT